MEKDSAAVAGNIRKLYWLELFTGALLQAPIIVLFLEENGLTLQQIFLLQGVFAATIMAWEIPSGYLSDRWGRRQTLILGTMLRFFGILAYALGTGLPGFLVAEILFATGTGFLSGNVEAMTYDTLLSTGDTTRYRKIIGHQRFLLFGAEAIGAVLAGGLALLSLRAPLWATVPMFGCAVLAAMTLQEPPRHKLQDGKHLHAMLRISRDTLLRSPQLRSITLLFAVLATLGYVLFWFTQPYQTEFGLPVIFFGITHAVIVTGGALASKYTHAMERWIDDRLFLLLIAVVMLGSIVALGFSQSLTALIFFLLVRMGWAAISPLTSDMVNRLTTSDIRATVLSVKSFAQRLLFAIASPIIGYAADVYTLNQAILMTGIVGAVGVAIAFLMMRPVWSKIPR